MHLTKSALKFHNLVFLIPKIQIFYLKSLCFEKQVNASLYPCFHNFHWSTDPIQQCKVSRPLKLVWPSRKLLRSNVLDSQSINLHNLTSNILPNILSAKIPSFQFNDRKLEERGSNVGQRANIVQSSFRRFTKQQIFNPVCVSSLCTCTLDKKTFQRTVEFCLYRDAKTTTVKENQTSLVHWK